MKRCLEKQLFSMSSVVFIHMDVPRCLELVRPDGSIPYTLAARLSVLEHRDPVELCHMVRCSYLVAM